MTHFTDCIQKRECKVPRVRGEHIRRVSVHQIEVPAHDSLAQDVQDDAGRGSFGRNEQETDA